MNFERKSIGAVVHGPLANELYVFSARKWPRWLNETFEESAFHEWDKELAPSTNLLGRWNSEEMSWNQWEDQYVEEVGAARIRGRAVHWSDVAESQGKDTVVFVCYEGEDDYPQCHTWSILAVLEGERQSGLSRFG